MSAMNVVPTAPIQVALVHADPVKLPTYTLTEVYSTGWEPTLAY